MDLYWGDFFVTGSLENVRKIIQILDWKDLIRGMINDSFRVPEIGFEMSDENWSSFEEIGLLIGVTEEVEIPHVAIAGDIDILIWNAIQNDHEASKLVFQQLEQDQALHVATKGAAFWSLRSIAEEHSQVAELCARESRVAGGGGRLYLQDM